jgi:Glyoxalase-like domain
MVFWQLTIDANDPALLARFWARALGYQPAVAELTGLGATVERRTRYDDPEDPVYFAVMHDPEGNEFCIG